MSRPFDTDDLPSPDAFTYSENGVPAALTAVTFVDDTHVEIRTTLPIGAPPLTIDYDADFDPVPWHYDAGADKVPSWPAFPITPL